MKRRVNPNLGEGEACFPERSFECSDLFVIDKPSHSDNQHQITRRLFPAVTLQLLLNTLCNPSSIDRHSTPSWNLNFWLVVNFRMMGNNDRVQ